jgi:predicted enzyme related to lactoylglutathione lyase
MQTHPRGELVLVLDCVDLDLVADFWTSALGYSRASRIHEPYLSLLPDSGHGPKLLLQRVPEAKGGKNRLHLDLRTRDLAAEVDRMRALGASVLTDTPYDEGGWIWHVLADPEGNEFCIVLQPPEPHENNVL